MGITDALLGVNTKLAGVQYVRYSMDMIVKILNSGALASDTGIFELDSQTAV